MTTPKPTRSAVTGSLRLVDCLTELQHCRSPVLHWLAGVVGGDELRGTAVAAARIGTANRTNKKREEMRANIVNEICCVGCSRTKVVQLRIVHFLDGLYTPPDLSLHSDTFRFVYESLFLAQMWFSSIGMHSGRTYLPKLAVCAPSLLLSYDLRFARFCCDQCHG